MPLVIYHDPIWNRLLDPKPRRGVGGRAPDCGICGRPYAVRVGAAGGRRCGICVATRRGVVGAAKALLGNAHDDKENS